MSETDAAAPKPATATTPAEPLEALRALPKAEVHIHLEGCFEAHEIAAMAREAGVALPRPEAELLQFQGLADFLEFLDFVCGLIDSREALARAAYRFCERMARAGTGHGDVIVNPTHWHHWRHDVAGMIEGLDAGFREAEEDGLATATLCISLLRQQGAAEAAELVELLAGLAHPRVAALSVDGNEAAAGRTGTRFAEAFRRAGEAGLNRTVHAGESSGPEGVWDALDLLGADRIDHGVRAIEDPRLVARLAESGVPLGVCPSSNLTLGLYPALETHPIEALRRAGVRVSVNTDDPALLAIDLPTEYAGCVAAFGWDDTTLRQIAATSIDASYAAPDRKAALSGALGRWRGGFA